MRLPSLFFQLSFFLFSFFSRGQAKEICILDLTSKNGELTQGNLFSVEHILKSGGYSYTVTTLMNEAVKSRYILASSNIESYTFSQTERDSLLAFVSRGGIWIAANVKDGLLFPYFGIASTSYAINRFGLKFKTDYNDTLFNLFNEAEEKQISLGSAAHYTSTIGTRSYFVNAADTLAVYESNEVAAFHKRYQKGHAYILGIQFKDLILRPQVKEDYKANRDYSNSFEPGQDVFIFLISGIFKRHSDYMVNKHTAPCNFKSALIITHDVDATSAMNMFDDYANYEKTNTISSTYMITTHYVHDKIGKDFFSGYEGDIKRVSEMGHDIQSHSVSHVPDFDIESNVVVGNPGNTRDNYQPFYDGIKSTNVSVYGEVEVSKTLLDNVTGKSVTCFRPGYLAFHNKLINVLDSLKYPISSSHSANNVLTNFPFFSHTDLNMSGRLTKVLEIPNHISDVFSEDLMSEENYPEKVAIWKKSFFKAYHNSVSSVLLVHPTRYYKLYAQQLLIQSLPQDAVILNLAQYGNFWLSRNELDYTTSINGDTLLIYLNKKQTEIDPMVSFNISNGKKFKVVKVYDSDTKPLPFVNSSRDGNDIIVHNQCNRPDYTRYSISENPVTDNVYIYPNPSDKSEGQLHFEIMGETEVSVSIYDMKGKLACLPVSKINYNLGMHDVNLSSCNLPAGMYVIKAIIGEEEFILKWILK